MSEHLYRPPLGPTEDKWLYLMRSHFAVLKWICTLLLLAFEGPGEGKGLLVTVGRLSMEESVFSLLGSWGELT